jgi:hypothetical protein
VDYVAHPSIQISKGNKARNRGRESFRRHFNILYLHEHVILLINNNEGGAGVAAAAGGSSSSSNLNLIVFTHRQSWEVQKQA